ncbi:hypothetical protein BS47DRAFT_1335910 [Hydnum rufescens UP504]|uniref:Phospholipid/glycerol acyltransferase domain-containing protein n=1 Tax=Hydnum rufescens UP504 TaxID=1448309 RepID=A0A9P6BA36_9AGAM|nr:hypothetical protein BS47DRAFT_1335910 [Hydnum rufescens UP504]
MPFGYSHDIILQIAQWGIRSFFQDIHVVNAENVPKTGPVIVACTHHNMSVDPAVLSCTFPHGRKLHYWAKSTLFGHPLAKSILLNAGNIPVDRKVRDNQVLFRGTFQALAAGEVVAIFPEGTSYTEPRIMQIKDGVSWTALEYFKWLQGPEGGNAYSGELVIVPVSLVYTDKARYRSSVVVEYGKPIPLAEYARKFLSNEDGVARGAVKSLTSEIGSRLVQMTVNAPDWDTLYSARMARHLLWPNDESIALEEWVAVNQTLVDLFSPPSPSSDLNKVKSDLLSYYSLLDSTRLTHSALSQLPLPRTLDPAVPAPLPSRVSTLWVLIRDTLASLSRLPFFFFPLLVHIPAYAMSRLGARLVEDEEETQAQNKILFGLLSLGLIYPLMFFFVWALLWLTPAGFVVAAITLWAFAVYHVRLVGDNYEHAKRLVAAWRVLIGVWGPREWDLSLSALGTYTKVEPPPPNPWLDQNKPRTPPPDLTKAQSGEPSATASAPTPAAAPTPKPRKRLPSRRLIRHVLRARLNASQALATFLAEVERSGQNVRASLYLAKQFDGSYDTEPSEPQGGELGFLMSDGPQGWRGSREVITFLRSQGARIAALQEQDEGDWAAGQLSSGDEGVEDNSGVMDELEWVPPNTQGQL